ncbi:MAG: sigma-70 family RNA polymerase sigma factor [Candidatus Eremiobacteraeota bacterium]|nr:sigma-70 family RNA polymerase sigma factor [Candidatus Eremiobacteraeota bacterium]
MALVFNTDSEGDIMATDDTLVTLAQKMEGQAFYELVKRYQKKIYHIAMGITRNHHNAEEVSQETFLSVYRKIGGLKNVSSFNTWIHRITTNFGLMNLRNIDNSAKISFDEPLQLNNEQVKREVVDWRMNPALLYEKKEFWRLVGRLIELLPAIYKTAFIIRVINGFSNQQAADALGISLPAVKSRTLRARSLLRKGLNLQWKFQPDNCQNHVNSHN